MKPLNNWWFSWNGKGQCLTLGSEPPGRANENSPLNKGLRTVLGRCLPPSPVLTVHVCYVPGTLLCDLHAWNPLYLSEYLGGNVYYVHFVNEALFKWARPHTCSWLHGVSLEISNMTQFEPLCSVISHKQEINKLINMLRGPPHSKGTVVSISFRVPC